jgi:hypothetical protein
MPASETAVPPHVGTMWLPQGNLNEVADLPVVGDAWTKVDFDFGRHIPLKPREARSAFAPSRGLLHVLKKPSARH